MTKAKKLKSTKSDTAQKLKAGDYILADGSAWLEYRGLVAHIFVPFGEHRLAVEILPVDCTMDDQDVIDRCSAELP